MVDEIPRLAAKQQGNVTYEQLLALGLTPASVRSRVRRGVLHRVHLGVYAVGRPATTPHERASAAVLACGPTAALSHGSAMTLWGLWKRWELPFEVTVTADRRPKRIKTHRSRTLHRRDVQHHLGIRTTTPARTIFDMATRLTAAQRTRVINDALHRHLMTEAQLQELFDRHPRHPATAHLKPFTQHQTGLTRSELEDQFLRFCNDYRLPTPQLNVIVNGYLVDAYFPGHGLIVELDGYEFHNTRIDFEKDRNRDADQLSEGIPTVRVTYERMTKTPQTEADRLTRILDSLYAH